jgi:cobalt transporter subunit CbtB
VACGEDPKARIPAVALCNRIAGGAIEEDDMASTSVPVSGSTERQETLRAALVAALLGLSLVFLTGFAQPQVLHNAAHDTRHSLSFPCH